MTVEVKPQEIEINQTSKRLMRSYVSGTSDTPLLGMTIGDMFDQIVEKYPDNEAVVSRHQNIRLTYRQLQKEVNQFAKGLLKLGLQKGQRIGIWSPNNSEWCITQFATSKLGTILVNINPAYRLNELEYALRQSGCTALIMAPQFKSSNYTQMLYKLCPELIEAQDNQLQSMKLPDLKIVIRMGSEASPGMYTWNEVMAQGYEVTSQELVERQRDQEFDDPINIQYTSGTTGFPKGATLSHHNILNNGFFVTELQKFTPDWFDPGYRWSGPCKSSLQFGQTSYWGRVW